MDYILDACIEFIITYQVECNKREDDIHDHASKFPSVSIPYPLPTELCALYENFVPEALVPNHIPDQRCMLSVVKIQFPLGGYIASSVTKYSVTISSTASNDLSQEHKKFNSLGLLAE